MAFKCLFEKSYPYGWGCLQNLEAHSMEEFDPRQWTCEKCGCPPYMGIVTLEMGTQ